MLESVRLTAVIEVYTGVLDAVQGGAWTEPQWDARYRAGVVEAGLPAPVAAHPWFVRARDVRPGPGLTKLIRAHLDQDEELIDRLRDPGERAEALMEVGILPGGFHLNSPERSLALPGCCGDLTDLANWREASQHRDGTPTMLWVGHPWLMVAAEEDALRLTGPVESSVAAGPLITTLGRMELKAAIDQAEQEVADFAATLEVTCAEIAGEGVAAALATALLGGDSPE